MKIREIKVREHIESPRKTSKFRSKAIPKPQLVLTGHWLKEAGIESGNTVRIQVLQDRLVITS
ncbi:MAG: SymE family type I addiction module toxin [Bacteroidetes bacterium]|nr:SymE family type I addiction module toxin [Bacteroidota bacterium]